MTDASLARVVSHDEAQLGVGDHHFLDTQAIPLDLSRPEMSAGDRHLLVGGVAVESNHLHAVEQRGRNGVGDVGRCDKQHLREIQFDIEIVIPEGVVLRRVEHLEQRCRRVAAPVRANLVDLVEHDHRIHRAGVAERPHEPSGERADVRAAMAAYFCLVAHAAE